MNDSLGRKFYEEKYANLLKEIKECIDNNDIDSAGDKMLRAVEEAKTLQEIEFLRIAFLGKKGITTLALKELFQT